MRMKATAPRPRMTRAPIMPPAIAPALGLREEAEAFCGESAGTLLLVCGPGGIEVVDETGEGLAKEAEVVGKSDDGKLGKSIDGKDEPIAVERDEDKRTDTVEGCEEDVVERESESTT